MAAKKYIETFDNGPGGWRGWIDNAQGPKKLEHRGETLTSRSPWWIDYNHAPPGAGYIHLLFCIDATGPITEHHLEVGGDNGLIAGNFGTDYTGAKFTFRLKGELENRGADLVLLLQGHSGKLCSSWALTSQPIKVTKDFSEQTITCTADESQWTCLGVRHGREGFYGYADFAEVMQHITNMILILFPLTIEPMGPVDGDMHILRPGKDYPVWRSGLPEGYVTLDTVEIEFAS